MPADAIPTGPGRRRGRRDNGLEARSYASLGDVDPRIGEHLLDALYVHGIAAYLEPTSDLDAISRATSLPRRPVDRLWVDRGRLADAKQLLAASGAEPLGEPEPPATSGGSRGPRGPRGSHGSHGPHGPVDEDAAWRQIVANFGADDPADGDPPWPAREDLPPGADPVAGVDTDGPDGPDDGTLDIDKKSMRGLTGRDELRSGGWRDPDTPLMSALDGDLDGPRGPEDEEEHYIPPPPPPVGRAAPQTVVAILAILAGGLLLIDPGLVGLGADASSFLLAVAALVLGVGMLVWRLRDVRDDDPDDGAVV
ncbi:MAG: hypothetical protein ACJ73S_06785 [Mycobacteriales bacterium]